MTHQKGIEIVD